MEQGASEERVRREQGLCKFAGLLASGQASR